MDLGRNATGLSYKDLRSFEVILTCGEQALPVDFEVLPTWPNGEVSRMQRR